MNTLRSTADSEKSLTASWRRRTLILSALVVGISWLCLTATSHAVTTISQGYSTADKVALGSLVSLKNTSSDIVNETTTDNVNSVIGVVIDSSNTLLSLSSGQNNQVQVATSGIAQALVSNINGDIHQGDSITASPISGVGMKATSNAKVVGIAQADLNTGSSSTESYTDKNGTKHTVRIGTVPLLVNVSYYYKQPDKTLIPAAIQNIANALAGKPVDTLPILICVAIFIITLVVVASIVYSMIRSSIISVGRNPMSQSAIYRDMTQMSALVIGILAVSVVSIYLVLAKF